MANDKTYTETLSAFSRLGFVARPLNSVKYERCEDTQMFPFTVPQSYTQSARVLLLRHDIDHCPIEAHRMAETEAKLGICSSFYVLTTDQGAKWWDDKQARKEGLSLLRDIQSMGHEVGLHYDALGNFLTTGTPVSTHLTETIAFLKSEGLKIEGCAAHGSRVLTDLRTGQAPLSAYECTNPVYRDYVSYNIWKDDKRGASKFKVHYLHDYGLKYEAYFINRDWYYADDHVGNHGVKGPQEYAGLKAWQIDPQTVKHNAVMQALFHPIKWKGRL